jgi:hypothetical protein
VLLGGGCEGGAAPRARRGREAVTRRGVRWCCAYAKASADVLWQAAAGAVVEGGCAKRSNEPCAVTKAAASCARMLPEEMEMPPRWSPR